MKVVAIGGGHGASATLKAALQYASSVAGVISVADDGGSSGRLARDLGVLPMGDIRNCLVALAPDSELAEVFQHRFSSGPLEGHVVGNLVIAAVAEETGSFAAAIDYAARMLRAEGKVVPPTLDVVRLVSEIGGEIVSGQVNVATATGRISYVSLDPSDPKPNIEAIELIEEADQVVLGPGSLFTSVLPPLLVPGVRSSFVGARGRKVYVCNLVAPPGETANFDAAAHLSAIYAHLGENAVDVVLVHEGPPPESAETPVSVDVGALESMGVEVVSADLIPASRAPRHDDAKLAEALRSLG